MTTHLVTYATPDMERSMRLCCDSARASGIQETWPWFEQTTKTLDFYRKNRALLDNPKGAGFWAWKSFIVQHHLQQMHDGDILIYSDAGVEFINSVNHIIDRMDQDIFLFGNMYEHAHWCKRDIIEAIFPPENPPYMSQKSWGDFGKQVQASVIFFRVNDVTRTFVKEWLDWCLFEGGRLIDDSRSRTPDHGDFRENRHDQAILTTLAYRDGIKLHWWPAVYNDGAFTYEKGEYTDDYPTLFHHHRRRNHEWSSAA